MRDSFQFKKLSDRVVFYESLETHHGRPSKIYKSVKEELAGVEGEGQGYKDILKQQAASTTRVMTMAKKELEKELRVLKDVFGVELKVNFEKKDSIKELIKALNACLNLKEVFERNIDLIKFSEKKSVISFFPSYFEQVLNENLNNLQKQIANVGFSQPIIDRANQVLSTELPKLVEEAIRRMLTARTELWYMEDQQDKHNNAYHQLLGAIGRVGNSGDLADQIYKIYHLDQFKEVILQRMEKQQNTSPKKILKSSTSVIKKGLHQNGGLTVEAIRDVVLSMAADTFNVNNGSIKVKAGYGANVYKAAGSKNVKADNIISFGIDPTIIQNTLEELTGKRNKTKDIEIFEELGRKMSGLRDGIIVYESSKNYTLNKGFERRGGFSAGTALSLQQLSVLKKIDTRFNEVIYAILQLADGAVGADLRMEQDLSRRIAQNIAFLLFDDFNMIGGYGLDKKTSASAIHVMNLNGILLPMSSILFLFAESIKGKLDFRPEQIVKVNIDVPKLLYDSTTPSWPKEYWIKQRNHALANTRISTHFLGAFKQLISNLF